MMMQFDDAVRSSEEVFEILGKKKCGGDYSTPDIYI